MVYVAMSKMKQWIYGIKSDKLLHFIFGMIVMEITSALCLLFATKCISVASGFVVALSVAAMKEWYDLKHGVPSMADFLWSASGAATGVFLVFMIMIC